MPRSVDLLLADALQYCRIARQMVGDRSLLLYANDDRLRLASERCLGNIGEAFVQIIRQWPDLLLFVEDVQKAVRLRNHLVHAYFYVSPTIPWSVIRDNVPGLEAELVRALEVFVALQEEQP